MHKFTNLKDDSITIPPLLINQLRTNRGGSWYEMWLQQDKGGIGICESKWDILCGMGTASEEELEAAEAYGEAYEMGLEDCV